MSLNLEILEVAHLSKGQKKKAEKRAAAAAVEEKSKAAAPEPTSMEEQIKALISAIKLKIEEISILIAEKQSIDDAYTQQLDELCEKQESNQQELDDFKAQLSKLQKELAKNEQIKKLLAEDPENDSVGGADIVQQPTAKSAKKEPTVATKAPTLAQKAAAAAALPPPSSTKAPLVAPALKGKEAPASSAVQLVKFDPFKTKKGGFVKENDFLTIVQAMCQILKVDTVCVQTFGQEILANLLHCLSIKEEEHRFFDVPCLRGGCKLAKHDAFKEKISQAFCEKSEETLSIFQMAVENLKIAGVNGMFDNGRFCADQDMREHALFLIGQYYQTIQ